MIADRDDLPRIFLKDSVYAGLDIVAAGSTIVGELLKEHHSLEG